MPRCPLLPKKNLEPKLAPVCQFWTLWEKLPADCRRPFHFSRCHQKLSFWSSSSGQVNRENRIEIATLVMEIRAVLSRKMSKIQPESVARVQKTLKRDSGSCAATSAALLVAFQIFYRSKSIHGSRLPASLKGFAPSGAEIMLSRSRKRSRSRRVDFFFFFFFFFFAFFLL